MIVQDTKQLLNSQIIAYFITKMANEMTNNYQFFVNVRLNF